MQSVGQEALATSTKDAPPPVEAGDAGVEFATMDTVPSFDPNAFPRSPTIVAPRRDLVVAASTPLPADIDVVVLSADSAAEYGRVAGDGAATEWRFGGLAVDGAGYDIFLAPRGLGVRRTWVARAYVVIEAGDDTPARCELPPFEIGTLELSVASERDAVAATLHRAEDRGSWRRTARGDEQLDGAMKFRFPLLAHGEYVVTTLYGDASRVDRLVRVEGETKVRIAAEPR